jgi:hypothetical protein
MKRHDQRLYAAATDNGQIIHRRRARETIDRDLGERLCEGSQLVLEGQSLCLSSVADIRSARIPIPSS